MEGDGGDQHRGGDQPAERDRAEGVEPRLFHTHVLARRVRPLLQSGAGVQKQVVGNDRGADQRQDDEQRARRHARHQRAHRQLPQARGGQGGDDAEHHAHHHHQRHQDILNRPVTAGQQQTRGKSAQQGDCDARVQAGQRVEAERGSQQVAGLEGGVAQQDGHRDKQGPPRL